MKPNKIWLLIASSLALIGAAGLIARADLNDTPIGISKAISEPLRAVGGGLYELGYTITVLSNTEISYNSLEITDVIPASFGEITVTDASVNNGSFGCQFNSGYDGRTNPTVVSQAGFNPTENCEVRYTVRFRPVSGRLYTNTAEATASVDNGESVETDTNAASVSFTPTIPRIEKTAGPVSSSLNASNQRVYQSTFQIEISSDGVANEFGYGVSDQLSAFGAFTANAEPANGEFRVTNIGASASRATVRNCALTAPSSETLIVNNILFDGAGSCFLEYTVQWLPSGSATSFTNTADLTERETVTGSAEATVELPAVTLEKRFFSSLTATTPNDRAVVSSQSIARYEVTMTATRAITQMILSDELPEAFKPRNLSDLGVTSSNCSSPSLTAGRVLTTCTNLQRGDAVKLIVIGQIVDTRSDSLTNTATARERVNSQTVYRSNTVNPTIAREQLNIGKTVGAPVPNANGSQWKIPFTVTVTNAGGRTFQSVQVTDALGGWPGIVAVTSANPDAAIDRNFRLSLNVAGFAPTAVLTIPLEATVTAPVAATRYSNTASVTGTFGSCGEGSCAYPLFGAISSEAAILDFRVVEGSVFEDANGDGSRQGSEVGLNGVAVSLESATPWTLNTVTASSQANAGTYRFVIPASIEATLTAAAPTGRTVSSGNPSSGNLLGNSRQTISAPTGQPSAIGYKLLPPETRTVSGTVFNDLNSNGSRDEGEVGLGDALVTLRFGELFERQTRTLANGSYSFAQIPFGAVQLALLAPAGGSLTTPATQELIEGNAAQPFGVHFTVIPTTRTITGTVFNDLDNNGSRDNGEPGLGDALVTLRLGQLVRETRTAPDGVYRFQGIAFGAATVTLTVPTGGALTAPSGPTQDLQERNAAGNFGVYVAPITRTIAGTVFDDANGNGLKDAGEQPLAGVPVELSGDTNSARRTISSSLGTYSFADVTTQRPVTVNVKPTAPAVVTTRNAAQTAVSGATDATLESVGVVTVLEFALVEGRVFRDTNGNDLLDVGEVGYPNVTVTISDENTAPNRVIARMPALPQVLLTDSAGLYRIQLPVGAYTITVTPPAGTVATRSPVTRAVVSAPAIGQSALARVQALGPNIQLAPQAIGLVTPAIQITKTAQQQVVGYGELIDYTVVVTNSSPIGTPTGYVTVTVTDPLPTGLLYQRGSSSLAGVSVSDPAITYNGVNRQELLWTFNQNLAPGAQIVLRFKAIVTPGAAIGIVNTAQARGLTDPLANQVTTPITFSNTASVRLSETVFSLETTILGRVYVDVNGNGRFDADIDQPVAGARVWLMNGRYAVSDIHGLYTLPALSVGQWGLRLDPNSTQLEPSPDPQDAGLPGSKLVTVSGGVLSVEWPLRPTRATQSLTRNTTVTRGPVKVSKAVSSLEGGYRVTLQVTVERSVQNLGISDPLPNGSQPSGSSNPARIADVTTGGLTWLRDGADWRVAGAVKAGSYLLTYALLTPLPPAAAVTDIAVFYEEIYQMLSYPALTSHIRLACEVAR